MPLKLYSQAAIRVGQAPLSLALGYSGCSGDAWLSVVALWGGQCSPTRCWTSRGLAHACTSKTMDQTDVESRERIILQRCIWIGERRARDREVPESGKW